jgi:hypothetical protein
MVLGVPDDLYYILKDMGYNMIPRWCLSSIGPKLNLYFSTIFIQMSVFSLDTLKSLSIPIVNHMEM